MNHRFPIAAAVTLAAVTLAGAASAQHIPIPRPNQPDRKIDAAERRTVIERLVDAVDKNYVYPETGQKMIDAIRAREKEGVYERITSSKDFADSLTAHLHLVSHDKHLRVRYSSDPLPERAHEMPTPEEEAKGERYMSARNYGFETAKRLPGNVGYLELRQFAGATKEASETAVAAMNFLGNTDALIIDIRQNGGGDGNMVALLSTYLFEPGDRVHLTDAYFRPDDQTIQSWTLPFVPGKSYAGKDVYVLTSGGTFSAAEEFAYNLKNLKRVTLVGETTGGGAHPVANRRLDDHFEMMVSIGRAINPISKTNWEGTGVEPDVKIAAPEALHQAQLLALNKLLDKATDKDDRDRLKSALEMVKGDTTNAPVMMGQPVIRRRVG